MTDLVQPAVDYKILATSLLGYPSPLSSADVKWGLSLAFAPVQNGQMQFIVGQLWSGFKEYFHDVTVPVFNGVVQRGHS